MSLTLPWNWGVAPRPAGDCGLCCGDVVVCKSSDLEGGQEGGGGGAEGGGGGGGAERGETESRPSSKVAIVLGFRGVTPLQVRLAFLDTGSRALKQTVADRRSVRLFVPLACGGQGNGQAQGRTARTLVTRGLPLAGETEAQAQDYVAGVKAGLSRLLLEKCQVDCDAQAACDEVQAEGAEASAGASAEASAGASAEARALPDATSAAAAYVRAVHLGGAALNGPKEQEARQEDYGRMHRAAQSELWPHEELRGVTNPSAVCPNFLTCVRFVDAWLARHTEKQEEGEGEAEIGREADLLVGMPGNALVHNPKRRSTRFLVSSADARALASRLIADLCGPREAGAQEAGAQEAGAQEAGAQQAAVPTLSVVATYRCNEVATLLLLAREIAYRFRPGDAPVNATAIELADAPGTLRCDPLIDAVRQIKDGPAILEPENGEQAQRLLANTLLLRGGARVVLRGLATHRELNGCRGVVQPYKEEYSDGWIVPPAKLVVVVTLPSPALSPAPSPAPSPAVAALPSLVPSPAVAALPSPDALTRKVTRKVKISAANLLRCGGFLCVMGDTEWDADVVPGCFVVDPSDNSMAGTVVSVHRPSLLPSASAQPRQAEAVVQVTGTGECVRLPLADLCATPDPTKRPDEQPSLFADLLRNLAEHVPAAHIASFPVAALAVVGDHSPVLPRASCSSSSSSSPPSSAFPSSPSSPSSFSSPPVCCAADVGSHLHPEAQRILQEMRVLRDYVHQHPDTNESTCVYDLHDLHAAIKHACIKHVR